MDSLDGASGLWRRLRLVVVGGGCGGVAGVGGCCGYGCGFGEDDAVD